MTAQLPLVIFAGLNNPWQFSHECHAAVLLSTNKMINIFQRSGNV
jgi:hypothetical protein